MSPRSRPAAAEAGGFPAAAAGAANWRLRLGLGIFVLGLLLPLLALLVPFLGLPAGLAALLAGALVAGAPELLFLLAVALLGRENFDRLTGALKGALRRAFFARPASRPRYHAGLALALASCLPLYLYGYGPGWMPDDDRIAVLAAGDLAFLLSLLLMGGEFWGKFRRIFVWDGRA